MISNDDEELSVYINEIRKLNAEFRSCDDLKIKKQIFDDMMSLLEVIKP